MTTQRERVAVGSAPAKPWWRRPWMIPLALLVLTFLYLSIPRYLSLDPAASMIPVNPGFGPHYPLLVAHIGFGTIAIVTAVLQVWPRLRARYPAVHRYSGRAYVFAGMVPAAILSLAITPFGLLDGVGALGSSVWAVLAIGTTLAGWQAARDGRYGDHRKFMVYSFALVTSILTGRAMFYGAWYGSMLVPDLANHIPLIAQTSGFWLNWIINLGIAHWWLRRSRAASPAASGTLAPTALPTGGDTVAQRAA